MTNVFYYIFYFGLFLIFLCVFVNYTCIIDSIEDNYHKIKKLINTHKSNIYLKVKYETSPKKFRKITKNFKKIAENLKNNLNNFCKKYNCEQTKIKLEINNNILIFSNITAYDECDNFVCKFYIDYDKKSIKYVFDHEYIGGSYIRDLSNNLLLTKQTSTHSFYRKSSILYLFYFIVLCYNYIKLPKIKNELRLKRVDDPKQICRYTKKYTIKRSENNKISSREIILYNGLKNLYKVLENKLNGRQLVCYLPIAFINTNNITNNIGLIWISIDKNTTIEDFNLMLSKSKYQALATNFIVYYKIDKLVSWFKKINNISNDTRNNVDVVLTSIYYKSDDKITLSWSYCDVAEYPIYLAISSCIRNNKIYVSETITSNIGKLDNCNYSTYEI
jgi:hypothetical protein